MKFLMLAAILVAQMQPPPAMTAGQIDNAQTGTRLNLVVRVDGLARNTIAGHILDRVTDSAYTLTKSTIAIYAPSDAAYVMGSADDLKPGAVVYVYAVATKAHAADATKIVIVTPYVSVK